MDGRTVRHQDLEKAAAADGDVEIVVGLLQVALVEHAFGGNRPATPVPSCRPDGNSVCCVDWPPGCRTVLMQQIVEHRRASCLKPLVLTVARLLEMASIAVCCASIPVLAIQ